MFWGLAAGRTDPRGFAFEHVLEGIQTGDTVVAGPYQAVRDMKDSTRVKQAKEVGATKRPGGGQ